MYNANGTLWQCCVGAHANHTPEKLATGGGKQLTFRIAHSDGRNRQQLEEVLQLGTHGLHGNHPGVDLNAK